VASWKIIKSKIDRQAVGIQGKRVISLKFFEIALFLIGLSIICIIFSEYYIDKNFYMLIFFYSLGAILVTTRKLREHPNSNGISLIIYFFTLISILRTDVENNIIKLELIFIIFSYYFISMRIEVLVTIFLYLTQKISNFSAYKAAIEFFANVISLILSPPKLFGIILYYISSYKIIKISEEWDLSPFLDILINHWNDFKDSQFFKVWPDFIDKSYILNILIVADLDYYYRFF
jgi:hypothetical protein